MKMRVRKLPILLPILLVIVLLIGAAFMMLQDRGASASHTDLGAKHLSESNYSGAAASFAESLAQNPTDVSARMGLAQAYRGLGDDAAVTQILEPLLESESPDAYRLLVQMQSENMDLGGALLTAQKLVDRTDKAEDYALRDELLQQMTVQNRTYASGTDQKLRISQNMLFSSGSNLFGQLGADTALGQDQVQAQFLPANFPQTPARVFCAGRTSYVVDTAGNLWAAGENRWGQMGQGTITLSPVSGWTKIVDTGDVAAVAGTEGTLFVLRTDGSLWYAGQGGIITMKRVDMIPSASAVAADGGVVAVLSPDGELYTWDTYYDQQWKLQAKNVKQFFLCSGVLTWVTAENEVCCSGYWFSCPEEWSGTNNGVIPPFLVRQAASDGRGLLVQDMSGAIYRLYDGYASEWSSQDAVYSIYAADGAVVLETDRGVQMWNLSEADPTVLSAP